MMRLTCLLLITTTGWMVQCVAPGEPAAQVTKTYAQTVATEEHPQESLAEGTLPPLTEQTVVQKALREAIADHQYANDACRNELAQLDIGAREKPASEPSLQQLINQTPRDADGWKHVTPGPYIYRETVRLQENNIVIDGEGKAEIRGSDLWTNWQETTIEGKTYWVSRQTVAPRKGTRKNGKFVSDQLDFFECHSEVPAPATTDGAMINTMEPGTTSQHQGTGKKDGLEMYRYSKCKWQEQVYIDGRALDQVSHLDLPRPGEFNVTQGGEAWSQRQIRLADNPQGHTVEVSVRTQWVEGGTTGDITVRNMVMRHTNGYVTGGALRLGEGGHWLVENNRLSQAESTNLALRGTGNVIRNNDIFCGGNQGMGGTNSPACAEKAGRRPAGRRPADRRPDDFCDWIVGNRIFFNNTESGSVNWHSAGIKLTVARNFLVEDNQIFANFGAGLWFDIDCDNNTIRGNTFVNNVRGVTYEISTNPTITDNVFLYNGLQSNLRATAAVEILSSPGGTVTNNTLISNQVGISLRAKARGNHTSLANTTVRGNTIIQSGRVFEGNPYRKQRNDGQMAIMVAQNEGTDLANLTVEGNRVGFVNGFRRSKFAVPNVSQQQGYREVNSAAQLRADVNWNYTEIPEAEAEGIARQYQADF